MPCGIDGVTMTSVVGELGAGAPPNPMEAARRAVTEAFGRVFDRTPTTTLPRDLDLSAPESPTVVAIP